MSELSQVLQSAMNLRPEDRALLAERLLSSLDDLGPEEQDRVWGNEALRRLDDYREGKASAIDAEEVHREARKLLK